MSGYNNTRSVFAGLVLGSVLLTGFWAWSADYPPQGGGSAFLGNLSGNDLTLASGDEIVWNGDTFLGRSAAGTAYVGATTGTADGTLRVDHIKAGDGSGGAPAYSFASDTDTGLWNNSGDIVLGHSALSRIRYNASITYFENLATGVQFNCNTYFVDDKRLGFGSFGYGDDAWMQGEKTESLTDEAANTIFSVSSIDTGYCGMTIHYTVECTDATARQAASGLIVLAFVDTAGGVVADVNQVNEASACSSGTLTTAWGADTTDDGNIEIQITPTSSLTPTTLEVRWQVISTSTLSRSLTVP